jgi:hypothetical protein
MELAAWAAGSKAAAARTAARVALKAFISRDSLLL